MIRRRVHLCALWAVAQALVAGVPIVGGPNRAVREAMREASQREVVRAGAEALAEAVRDAVGPSYEGLCEAARRAGRHATWEAALPRWEAAIMRATRQRRVERGVGSRSSALERVRPA